MRSPAPSAHPCDLSLILTRHPFAGPTQGPTDRPPWSAPGDLPHPDDRRLKTRTVPNSIKQRMNPGVALPASDDHGAGLSGWPPVSGTPVMLGRALLVGEALGLLGGLAEGVTVGEEAGLVGRPLAGPGAGLAFTGGGGLLVAVGVRGVGDSRSVTVARGRPVPSRSLTSPLAGCVAGRSGEGEGEALGGSVTRTSGSSGDARSGLGTAPGVPADGWGSSSAVARLRAWRRSPQQESVRRTSSVAAGSGVGLPAPRLWEGGARKRRRARRSPVPR